MPHAQPTQHHHHCCAIGRGDGTAPATARHCPHTTEPKGSGLRPSLCIGGCDRMHPGGRDPAPPEPCSGSCRAPCSTAQHHSVPGRRSKGYTPSTGARG
eukprot:scaffold34_cov62-Phaeocystis_antarctica.AAC.9